MTARPQHDAICCECGRTRKTSTYGAAGEFDSSWRCVVWRRCATCRRKTRHAYLLERHDVRRDEAEVRDRLRTAELQAQLEEEIDRLRSCQVRVGYSRRGVWEPDEVARLTQYLDDGVYCLALNPAAARDELLRAVERTWQLWTSVDSAGWYVKAASIDDPASLPHRTTTLLHAAGGDDG